MVINRVFHFVNRYFELMGIVFETIPRQNGT